MIDRHMADDNKNTYRNATKTPQVLMGVGRVEPGQTVEVEGEVNNPNFVKVDTRRFVNVEAPVAQPEPNTMQMVDKPIKTKK